jgi:hypothetical protein
MPADPTCQELNAKLARLLLELDAKTAALVRAFLAPEIVHHRAPPHQAMDPSRQGLLSALKADLHSLATDSFAIALRCRANAEAPPAGIHCAARRPGDADEFERRELRRSNHPDERALWSDGELDARWEEYQDLLRRTGECLGAIEAHLRERVEQESPQLSRPS